MAAMGSFTRLCSTSLHLIVNLLISDYGSNGVIYTPFFTKHLIINLLILDYGSNGVTYTPLFDILTEEDEQLKGSCLNLNHLIGKKIVGLKNSRPKK